jgi:RNA polymerase sigma-70 factor (ECF subfamily)
MCTNGNKIIRCLFCIRKGEYRVLSGDQRASFEELATPLLKPLYNFARWLTRDTHEAEDLVQEAFTRALKGFGGFQPGTNFRAWMFRILRNAFLSSRSNTAVHLSIEESEEQLLPSDPHTPESLLMESGLQERIQSAIERLPIPYREVLLLCDVEEMKYQEIATLVGVPVGTVMSRISRARKLLRGMLAEDGLRMEK